MQGVSSIVTVLVSVLASRVVKRWDVGGDNVIKQSSRNAETDSTRLPTSGITIPIAA